jgi:hypothetical protein
VRGRTHCKLCRIINQVEALRDLLYDPRTDLRHEFVGGILIPRIDSTGSRN